MKITYRYYEPDQELEEQQAKIYSEASGNPATGEEIKARFQREKIDPKTVCYAFSEDSKMVAYCQARDYPFIGAGETHLGYPWALPDCPAEVQDKLFDDILAYIKQREETLLIRAPAALENEKVVAYFKKKGLVEVEWRYSYSIDLDVTQTSKLEIDNGLTSRSATEDDISLLLEIAKSNPEIISIFPGDDAWIEYFKDRVFKQAEDGARARYPIIVFDGDQAVCASAPLRMEPDGRFVSGDKEKIIFRFQITKPGYVHAWKTLAKEFAKECLTAGWADVPIQANIGFPTNEPLAAVLAATQSDLEAGGIVFGLAQVR
ncbi:MAG: hypothetical protein ACXAB4_13575 [Candidatus Hodarchaeales archaeon]|jgi:hypothetical protein